MEPTKDFQKELNAALAALAKDSAESIADECPYPEAVIAHVRGSVLDDQIATHLLSCQSCSELAAVAQRQKKIYESQKQAFQRAASEKRSWKQDLTEAFLPLAWLRRPAAIGTASIVVVVVLGLSVWQKADFGIRNHGVYSANQLVVNIQKSDPHNPAPTEASLQDVLNGIKQGERIDPAQIQQARFAVDQKKTAVFGTPDLSMKWDNIDDQLAVVEWWNRYQVLRKEGNFVVLTPNRVSDLSGSDGTGRVRLSWYPSNNDISLLKASLFQTEGLDQVIITTPENKTVTLAASNKQPK